MANGATTSDSTGTFRQFAAAINSHDINALVALMTANHVFVDSAGNRTEGTARMEAGWRSYFEMCPDYWIRIDQAIAEGGVVLAIGEAGGTIYGLGWRTPAAWKGGIRDGKVAEWRVFADNRPVYEILAKRAR